MPILDPLLQTTLLQLTGTESHDKTFFIKYIKIASINLHKNLNTIKSSIQFKKDIKNCITFFNKYFDCNISLESDIDNPSIKDIYRHLFDKINPKYRKLQRKQLNGSYITNMKSKLSFFQPFIEFSYEHRWYFTTTPIAILCIDASIIDQDKFEDMINIFSLEVDLIIGSGLTVVLCIDWEVSQPNFSKKELIINFIKFHNFTEIHFNLEYNKENAKKEDLEDFLTLFSTNIVDYPGYIYFYTRFFKNISEKCVEILKQLKHELFFQYFQFATKIKNAFTSIFSFSKTDKFLYCKTGFDKELIFIRISNIPLYNSDDIEVDLVPSEISNNDTSYVFSKDILDYSKQRIKILLDREEEYNDFCYKYIDINDIHLVKIDQYVNDSLILTEVDESILEKVEQINKSALDMLIDNNDFKKQIFTDKKFEDELTYVIYAYNYNANINNDINNHFFMHTNQVFTAYDACKFFLEDSKLDHGIIYQVETGEGKSCIVCLIAAVLALMNKTVHITSSNITLANRDYHQSYLFFKQLGLTSAILLHYNELPIHISGKSNNNFNNDNSFIYNPDYFPEKFFKKSLFKNPSNMNFSVCGINDNNEITKNKANIVFSTFVNLECLYLRMIEMCPNYIKQFFQECYLIIDEADSILIDELNNGTILSRTLQTNGDEILKFVYKSYLKNKNADNVCEEIKKKWPNCVDINENDVKDMFFQINIVNQDEFTDGKKYSIETINEKEKITLDSILENANDAIKTTINKVKKIFHKKEKNKDGSKFKFKDFSMKMKTYKQIVPFDYDHKGILEPNKEFSGFIQQFIAIKEMHKNKKNNDIIIKDISMNYLYISHPIFISFYKNVCGVTGTIGGKNDISLLKKQYNLKSKKIPRQQPNLRVEYPLILCEDLEERNNKILLEVIDFHNKDYPVLVIFQDLNEITDMLKLFISRGLTNINIFDGKNDKIKPDTIIGNKGAISFGSNICGRGTDIKYLYKPLHVILSYYSMNSRVIYQAFGRTARQGNKGTVRIICIKQQYFSPNQLFCDEDMKNILDNFQSKNELQRSFIEKYRKKRSWIFSGIIEKQNLSNDDITKMRECRINVNRIKACNYKFPIYMSIPTFLIIQAQKIFSLYNCPNCKYTWMLFQKYIREMVLESWSLFIEKTEKEYYEKSIKIKYSDYVSQKIDYLYECLNLYLPESEKEENYEIVPTFMNIFGIVRKKFEEQILELFPDDLLCCLKQSEKQQFCSYTIGFKPYSLIDKSGARINTLDGEDQKQTYINDPELKYMRKLPHHYFSLLSITERIDGIFNMICQKINNIIGSYIGLKFFLRRTLGGCEFGVCYDFEIENSNEKIFIEHNCLVDRDPLLLFTISVKSMIPILAGILIIGLVYIASVAKSIFEWITNFVGKGLTEIVKITVKEIASRIVDNQIEKFVNAICLFLQKQIIQQIVKMKEYRPEIAKIFNLLLKISGLKDFEKSGDFIKSMFAEKISIKTKLADEIIDGLHIQYFLKIGFLLMLCLASFMMNFHFHKQSIKYNTQKVSSKYDKEQNTEKVLYKNQNIVKNENIDVEEKFDFKNG